MDNGQFAIFELKTKNSALINTTKEMIKKLEEELKFLVAFQDEMQANGKIPMKKLDDFEEKEHGLRLLFRAFEDAYNNIG